MSKFDLDAYLESLRAEGAAAERARILALLETMLKGVQYVHNETRANLLYRQSETEAKITAALSAVRSASPSAAPSVGEDTEPETSFKMPPALKVRLEEDR